MKRMSRLRVPSTSLRFAPDDKTAMLFCQLLVYLGKGVHREFQVFAGMRCGDLCANACGAVWNDRIEESDHVNAFLQHARGELL